MPTPPTMNPKPSSPPPPVVYISFCAEITPVTSESLLKACADLVNKNIKTIYLLLSTPGGSVMHGIAVYNTLRALPCKIITHNVGAIDSIGTILFLAGEKRYANPSTTFMFHGVGVDISANTRFEEKFLRERLDSILADQKKIGDIIRNRTNFSDPGEIDTLFLEAVTKDAQFAKDRGIVDDIREAKVPQGAPIFQLVFKR
jgi:ATP-dependent Clp protease, protease subunit